MIAETIGGVCRLMAGAPGTAPDDRRDDDPCVYFANHASHLDVVILWSALPPRIRRRVRPVAGRDYWSRNRVRRFVSGRVFHAVLIDRGVAAGRPAAARATIAAMTEALDLGGSLIIFPEGTRSLNGTVGPFKSGLYHLSRLRPGIDLIPVLLENTHRILPKGHVVPVPARTRVVFGTPLRAADGEDKQTFLARARGALLMLGGCDGRRH
jgi:1-acyl-sn-glycerol-3-phosphate acyltransferase